MLYKNEISHTVDKYSLTLYDYAQAKGLMSCASIIKTNQELKAVEYSHINMSSGDGDVSNS